MKPIYNRERRAVGWLNGDVLLNAAGETCAFVRGRDVLTFQTGRIGGYGSGLFRDTRGEIVGCVGSPACHAVPRQRRKRYQIAPWLCISRPAPQPIPSFRTWAIWDRALAGSVPH